MKATITSTYHLRDKAITSFYHYPVFSKHIEDRMSKQLKFLTQYDSYSLELKIHKNKS